MTQAVDRSVTDLTQEVIRPKRLYRYLKPNNCLGHGPKQRSVTDLTQEAIEVPSGGRRQSLAVASNLTTVGG